MAATDSTAAKPGRFSNCLQRRLQIRLASVLPGVVEIWIENRFYDGGSEL
jgi:hypothetical protein